MCDLEVLRGCTRGNIPLHFDCNGDGISSSFSGLGLMLNGSGVSELQGVIPHRNVLLTSRDHTQVYFRKGCH